MFKVDFSGVEESGDFSPAPAGTYTLKVLEIEEGKSQRGHNMVNVTLAIVGGSFDGKKVFHKVTFIPKGEPGAGFSKHWLKVIGQPYEGEVTVSPLRWRGARLEADLSVEDYENKEGVTKKKNKLENIRAVPLDKAQEDKKQEEQVPF